MNRSTFAYHSFLLSCFFLALLSRHFVQFSKITCRLNCDDNDLEYNFYLSRGQTFFLLNLNSMTYAFIALFVAILSIPTILKILIFTKQSATPESAYKRYKASALHSQNWYQFPIKPGTK